MCAVSPREVKKMRIVLDIPFPKWRDPRKIPRYIRHYRNLPQPQWADPSKRIGFWKALKLWWVIEGNG